MKPTILLISFLFFVQFVAGTSLKDLEESLMLYMPFNGNANDESGNKYRVTVSGASLAKDKDGNENSAYYFDGSSYISVYADDAVLNVDTTGFTFSFWVKPDSGQQESATPIISYGSGNMGGYNVDYWEDYGMFRTNFYDYSWSGIYVAKDEFDLHDWYLYTFTYNGKTLKVTSKN